MSDPSRSNPEPAPAHARAPAPCRRGALRRFRKDGEGVVAVEFAMVITPFLAIMFAILETGLVFFAGQILETAVGDAARLVLTGQAQAGKMDQATFRAALCARIPAVLECDKVQFDMRVIATFGAAPSSPIKNGSLDVASFKYECGSPGQIVALRAFYEYPVFVSLMGSGLAYSSGNPAGFTGKRVLTAAAAWRNEPFSSGSSC